MKTLDASDSAVSKLYGPIMHQFKKGNKSLKLQFSRKRKSLSCHLAMLLLCLTVLKALIIVLNNQK